MKREPKGSRFAFYTSALREMGRYKKAAAYAAALISLIISSHIARLGQTQASKLNCFKRNVAKPNLVKLKLARVQLVILTALSDQLLMSTALQNATMLQHHDEV